MPAHRLTASIALCTYNGTTYLRRQLDSIFAQTRLPSELIVADDRSTDGTRKLIEDFAATSPFPVRFSVNDRNLGYRANFISAAQRTSGDIIFFCDQDDVWHPTKLDVVCGEFERRDALLVYHNAAVVDSEERELSTLYSAPEQLRALAQKPMPPRHYSLGFTQAFRRELLSHDDLWPESLDHMTGQVMAHDQWYFFLAASLGRIRFVDEPLVRHRQHGGNTYGVADGGSRWRRLASRFTHRPEWDRLEAEAARQRAAILTRLCERNPPFARRGTELIEAYTSLAERHGRRYAAYTSPTLARRAAAFTKALLRGDYRGRPWGLDPRALPRDFLVGALNGSTSATGH
jgi:glycosyltransferase involved in cell wall biosynthesis